MKKLSILLVIGLLCGSMLAKKPSEHEITKIKEAIKLHDVSKVKSLVRDLDDKKMSLKEKQEVFAELLQQAELASQGSKTPTAYAKNWRDTWKSALGVWFIYGGVMTYVKAEKGATDAVEREKKNPFIRLAHGYTWDDRRKELTRAIRFLGIISGAIGLIPFYFGVKASNQKAVIEQAEDIEHYLKNRSSDLEPENSKDTATAVDEVVEL